VCVIFTLNFLDVDDEVWCVVGVIMHGTVPKATCHNVANSAFTLQLFIDRVGLFFNLRSTLSMLSALSSLLLRLDPSFTASDSLSNRTVQASSRCCSPRRAADNYQPNIERGFPLRTIPVPR